MKNEETKINDKDLGFIDDAISCIADEVCSQDHLIEIYNDTKEDTWLEIATEVRRNRANLLSFIVKAGKGDRYCVFKHLLGASKKRRELGDRFMEMKRFEEAKEQYSIADSYEKVFKLMNGYK